MRRGDQCDAMWQKDSEGKRVRKYNETKTGRTLKNVAVNEEIDMEEGKDMIKGVKEGKKEMQHKERNEWQKEEV